MTELDKDRCARSWCRNESDCFLANIPFCDSCAAKILKDPTPSFYDAIRQAIPPNLHGFVVVYNPETFGQPVASVPMPESEEKTWISPFRPRQAPAD